MHGAARRRWLRCAGADRRPSAARRFRRHDEAAARRQTCALIKRHPKFASTPVVLLSSKDGSFDRARGRLSGSNLYITTVQPGSTAEGRVRDMPAGVFQPVRRSMPISSIMVVDASPTDRQFLNLLDLEALLSHPDFLCIEDAE